MQTLAQLRSLIDSTFAQLQDVQALKASLITQKAALITGGIRDATSWTDGGEGGGESVTVQSLTTQIVALGELEKTLLETYETLSGMDPWTGHYRLRVGGSLI